MVAAILEVALEGTAAAILEVILAGTLEGTVVILEGMAGGGASTEIRRLPKPRGLHTG